MSVIFIQQTCILSMCYNVFLTVGLYNHLKRELVNWKRDLWIPPRKQHRYINIYIYKMLTWNPESPTYRNFRARGEREWIKDNIWKEDKGC